MPVERFVERPASDEGAAPPHARTGALGDAVEACAVVDRAIVRLAARRRTFEDLVRLRASLARMASSLHAPVAFAGAELELHAALGAASDNAVLAATRLELHLRTRELDGGARRRLSAAELLRAWAEVVDAVEGRNGDEAARVIERVTAEASVRAPATVPPPRHASETEPAASDQEKPAASDVRMLY